jgi:hypothetical protein
VLEKHVVKLDLIEMVDLKGDCGGYSYAPLIAIDVIFATSGWLMAKKGKPSLFPAKKFSMHSLVSLR